MNQIIDFIKKHATKKTILILLALTILGEVVLGYSNYLFTQISNVSALDLSFFYTVDFANDFFSQISSEAVFHYLWYFTTLDIPFPMIISTFFALLVAYILEKKKYTNSKLERLILFPYLSAVFDYLENISIVVLMNLPETNQGLVWLLTISSSMKWIMSFVGMSMLVVLLLVKKNWITFIKN